MLITPQGCLLSAVVLSTPQGCFLLAVHLCYSMLLRERRHLRTLLQALAAQPGTCYQVAWVQVLEMAWLAELPLQVATCTALAAVSP